MSPLPRILVLAHEPMVAALVGFLVETTGRTVVFSNPNETPSDAVARCRPLAVVLVDASLDAARSDLFFAAMSRHRLGAIVFDADRRVRGLAEIAAVRGIPWVIVPTTTDDLGRAIDAGMGQRPGRGLDRREEADATTAGDGVHILRDRDGHRWIVYDRRGPSDRRNTDGSASADGLTRVFVSDEGVRREYGLVSDEQSATAILLEQQLSDAHSPS